MPSSGQARLKKDSTYLKPCSFWTFVCSTNLIFWDHWGSHLKIISRRGSSQSQIHSKVLAAAAVNRLICPIVPLFHCSIVPLSYCPVPLFHCSIVPFFHCYIVLLFFSFIVPLSFCSVVHCPLSITHHPSPIIQSPLSIVQSPLSIGKCPMSKV